MSRYTDHPAPEGVTTRGTILVVPGRGETHETYARLGARLSADAYHVRVVDPPLLDPADPAPSLTRFAKKLGEAADAPDGVPAVRPVVVIGSDAGAAAVAAVLARTGAVWQPDGVVLAGLPSRAAPERATWEEELDLRTACPVHRRRLTEDGQVHRGALGTPVPAPVLALAEESEIPVPALLLAGDADPLADHQALLAKARSLPRARLSRVRGAHHDVLNDAQHRSVAAEIVTFLEGLRDGMAPAVSVAASAW
ncbi:alpha/beta hydrolase [Streptomyces albidoflavus]